MRTRLGTTGAEASGGEGTISVSQTSEAIDPFEAVKGDVARSKDLVASATSDLRQHDRWFRDYLASEARNRVKHARQLERRRDWRKRRIKRQKIVRTGKRLAAAHLRFARAVSSSFLRSVSAALRHLRRLLLLVIRWIGPKTRALALSLIDLSLAGALWLGPKIRALSLAVFEAAAASASWVAVKTVALARSLMPVLVAGVSWLGARARGLEGALFAAALIGSSWLRVRAWDLTLVLLQMSKAAGLRAQRGLGRLRAPAGRLAEQTKSGVGELKRAISAIFEQHADSEGKPAALPREEAALERSQALVPVEPPRCRLPVIQTS
jgi:hypothetical protein